MTGSGRPKVVYWGNQPTPYVVGRFNAVVDRGTIDLEAWFETEREPDRSWEVDRTTWRFPARFIRSRRILGWEAQIPTRELRTVAPDVIVLRFDRVHAALGTVAARATATRVASRSLPVFEAWSHFTRSGEFAKHLLYRSIEGAKVPGPDGTAMVRHYGMPDDRVWRVTQSIDVDHYRTATAVERSWRDARRAQLGLRGCVFIYVGRLWSGKGVQHLIEAHRRVMASGVAASLVIVGDGVDEPVLRQQASNLHDVLFAGFVQPASIPEWYALADVMVFPTLGDPNGLVVEEAMTAGLPVVATETAGDIRLRVRQGVNGFVVPPADPSALAERMLLLARDPDRRERMGRHALAMGANFEHSRYAVEFEQFIFGLLDRPPRHGCAPTTAAVLGRLLMRSSTGPVGELIPPAPSVPTRAGAGGGSVNGEPCSRSEGEPC